MYSTAATGIEEIKRPGRVLPRALITSVSGPRYCDTHARKNFSMQQMVLVTAVYLACNASYFAVLTPAEMLQSEAVAVSTAERVIARGKGSFFARFLLPLSIACTIIGTLNSSTFQAARLTFAVARERQLPSILGMIHVRQRTPVPALLLNLLLCLPLLLVDDLGRLLLMYGFLRYGMYGLSVVPLVWLRWRKPDLPRPYRLPLVLPIAFILICAALMAVAVWQRPVDCGVAVGVSLLAFPVYAVFLADGTSARRVCTSGEEAVVTTPPSGGSGSVRFFVTPPNVGGAAPLCVERNSELLSGWRRRVDGALTSFFQKMLLAIPTDYDERDWLVRGVDGARRVDDADEEDDHIDGFG